MASDELILGRYQPLFEAGAGGFATVIVAFDVRIQRQVAIKIIELTDAQEARAALPGANAVSRDQDDGLPVRGNHVRRGGEAAGRKTAARAAETAVLATPAPEDVPPWEDLPAAVQPTEEIPVAGLSAAERPTEDIPVVQPTEEIPPVEASPAAVMYTDDPASTMCLYPAPVGELVPAAGVTERLASAPADDPLSPAADVDPLLQAPLMTRLPGLDEARTAAMLDDPSIVTVYDFEVRDHRAYLIMEYVEGLTLAQFLERFDDDLTLPMIAAVFQGVARALEAAHARGVLHLDIKPDNVLINKKGQVKVSDFGLATLADASGLADPGGGTIGYMPLEQMRQHYVDARSDQWSLAALAYEMIAGENPFEADDLRTAEARIEQAELLLPSLCWEDLPPEADDALFRALSIPPEGRYESVNAFAEDFLPLLGSAKTGTRQIKALMAEGDEPVDATEPLSPAEPRLPLRQRVTPQHRRAAARVVGALGTGLLGLVAGTTFAGVLGMAFDGVAVQAAGLLIGLAVGALTPRGGAAAGYLALSIAFIVAGAPAVGCVLLAAAAAWWWFVGREDDPSANGGLAAPLAGACWLAPVAPLAAGMIERPVRAAATAAFSLVTSVALGSCAPGAAGGVSATGAEVFAWPVVELALHGVPASAQAGATALVTTPAPWILGAGWVAAAGLFALLRNRPTRGFAIFGAIAATLVLLGAVAACAAAAGVNAASGTLAAQAASTVASGVLAVAFATLVNPEASNAE
ncbi:protein kinase [Eggerthellaceae bacterium zg-893]|nr:protein kinase [Eggerthellaceae bacterium zg-893]